MVAVILGGEGGNPVDLLRGKILFVIIINNSDAFAFALHCIFNIPELRR